MVFARRILIVVAALVVATSALSQNVVGNWKGKVVLDTGKIPRAQNPAQQKQIDAALGMVKKMQIGLSLKANKTFVATVSGIPGQTAKTQTSGGTWKQTGNTIVLTATSENGKPKKDNSPQSLTIAIGGRSMTMTPGGKGGMGQGVNVVFTR